MSELQVVHPGAQDSEEPQELPKGYAFVMPPGLQPVFSGERRAMALKIITNSLREGDFNAVDLLIAKDPSLVFSETADNSRVSVLMSCLRFDHLGAAVVAVRHGLDINQRPWVTGGAHTPLESLMFSNTANTNGIGLLLSLGADIRQVRPDMVCSYLIDAADDADDRRILLALRHGITQETLEARDPEVGAHVLTRVLSTIARKDTWKTFDAEMDGALRRDRVIAALVKAGANPNGSGDHPSAQPLDNAIGTKNGPGICALLKLGARHKGDLIEELAQAGMHDIIPEVKEALILSTAQMVAANASKGQSIQDAPPEEGRVTKAAKPRARYDL